MNCIKENDSLRKKNKTYYNTMKILLYFLKHEKPEQNSRQFNVKNVNRLLKIFELKDYLRLKTENHISTFVF